MKATNRLMPTSNPFRQLELGQGGAHTRDQLTAIMLQAIPSEATVTLSNGQKVYPPSELLFSLARLICVYTALRELHADRLPTMSAIRARLARGPRDFGQWLQDHKHTSDVDDFSQELGTSLLKMLVAVPKEFLRGFETAKLALEIETSTAA